MRRSNVFAILSATALSTALFASTQLFAQERQQDAAPLSVSSQSPSPQSLSLTQSGKAALERNDPASARQIFLRLIAGAPNNADGYLGLGMAELREGKPEEASQALLRASELSPQLPGTHLFLGIAQYQSGDPESALKSLQAELNLQPSSLETLMWMGIIQLDNGHAEEAASSLDQAAALDPKNAEVLYYCAHAHRLIAEAAYRKLSALDPDSALVHRALAETFADAGEPEKSIAEYEAAIRKEPKNAELYEGLGVVNQKMGRKEAAAKAYRQELELHPNSAIALYNLGMLEVKAGRAETGVPILRKAVEAHAMPAPTYFYLGLGLAQLDQNQEAAHWLELALQNSPSSFVEQGSYYELVHVYQKLNRKADSDRALTHLKRLKAEAASKMSGGEQLAHEAPASSASPQ